LCRLHNDARMCMVYDFTKPQLEAECEVRHSLGGEDDASGVC